MPRSFVNAASPSSCVSRTPRKPLMGIDTCMDGVQTITPFRTKGSRYRGVYYEADKKLWRARIYWRGAHTTIGRFSTAEAAARAHDRAAVYVFGPAAAVTNFVLIAASSCDTRQLKASGLRDKVVARLARLRTEARQAACSPYLQSVRNARDRRLSAASKALGVRWVDSNGDSVEALVQNRRWRALILAAVLAPPFEPSSKAVER
jgi:AP2 domain